MKYLYCVVLGKDDHDDLPRGLGGARLSALPIRQITAFLSDVQDQLYSPRVDDVLAHHAVVTHAWGRYPAVLPCRFGTVISTQQETVALLQLHYPLLETQLRHLTGKVEIGIKALITIPACPTKADPGHWQQEGDKPGTRYLVEKQRQSQQTQVALTQADGLIQSFTCATSPFVTSLRSERHPLEDGLLTTIYALVPSMHLASFKQCYELWQDRYAGVQFLYTGPWPPYTFAILDLRHQPACPRTMPTVQQDS